jgi:hypothetical protein
MAGVRELESRVRDDGIVMARISAYHTLVPYTDPRCYPLYAKCVELDIPISINVGVPGPLVPAAQLQDPIHLDEICAFDRPGGSASTAGGTGTDHPSMIDQADSDLPHRTGPRP